MNLTELYSQTPVERHADIKVCGDRVFVLYSDGSVDEYLNMPDGELFLVRPHNKVTTPSWTSTAASNFTKLFNKLRRKKTP